MGLAAAGNCRHRCAERAAWFKMLLLQTRQVNDNGDFPGGGVLHLHLTIIIYLIKFSITQTMFCIASCRPSLKPHIFTALDHAHTTDHCLNDYHI